MEKKMESNKYIAVFCKYQRDFDELEPTPRKMFVQIRNIHDLRGRFFIGIIRMYGWYRKDREITEAYDCLRARQPELFNKEEISKLENYGK